MQVPAPAVAAEVIRQGGDAQQAWVAAALVSGVESDGDPTELSGGIGPAAGLFQFEPGTWIGNGGGTYAPVAQGATWQQQVTVFLNATAGDSFRPWGPDVKANGGDPNSSSNPAYGYTGGVQAGSKVANKISDLSATGAFKFLGNVPKGIADAGGAVAAPPTPNPLVNAPSGVAGAPSLPGFGDWTASLGHILGDLGSVAWWERLGMGALGVLLFGVGLSGFLTTTKPGQAAKGAIGPAVKDAAAVAVVA